MAVTETSPAHKNYQILHIINQKIIQKLVEKISMTDIAHQLLFSTSIVIRKRNGVHFKHDFLRLSEIMSQEEYDFTKGKMSFIKALNIMTILKGRRQVIIRNHFLRYKRALPDVG